MPVDNAGNREAIPSSADDSTLVDTVKPVSSASSPTYSNTNGFTVSYDAACKDERQELRYRATITGRADGALRFTVDGRSTDGTVYCVVEGHGQSKAGDRVFEWGPRDVFVVPSWCTVSHAAREDAVLFSFSDRPAQKAMGIWREAAPACTCGLSLTRRVTERICS